MNMYKRLTVVRLKELCSSRGIDCDNLTYKRDFVHVLQRYDAANDGVCHDDDDNESGANAASVRQEQASISDVEGEEGDQDTGDGGFQGDDNEVTFGNPPDARGNGEPESVVLMRLRLAVAQENRKAKEEERRMREEERIAQERAWQRERERPALQPPNPMSGNVTVAEFRDVKALLPNMTDDADPLAYFISLERILELHSIDRMHWARLLPSQLSPKALKIFSRLSIDESRCYDTVKRTILSGFKLDASYYLQKFRHLKRTGPMTYKMFLTNLRELASRYFDAKGIDSLDKMIHCFVLEQFLNSLSDNVRQFVVSKQPENVDKAAEYADLHFELSKIGSNHQGMQRVTGTAPVRFNGPQQGTGMSQIAGPTGQRSYVNTGRNEPVRCFRPAGAGMPNGRFAQPLNRGNYSRNPLISHRGEGRNSGSFQNRGTYSYFAKGAMHDYGCNDTVFYDENEHYCTPYCDEEIMHITDEDMNFDYFDDCVENDANDDNCMFDDSYAGVRNDMDIIVPVFVNGKPTTALRDTGNLSMLIVDEKLVPKTSVRHDESVLCSGVFDGSGAHRLPTAVIQIRSPHFGFPGNVNVRAIVTKLPKDINVIIGNSFYRENPHLTDIISVRRPEVSKSTQSHNVSRSDSSRKRNLQSSKVSGIKDRKMTDVTTGELITQGVKANPRVVIESVSEQSSCRGGHDMADGNLAPVNSGIAQIDPATSVSDRDGRFDETRQMDGSADRAHNVDDGERQDGTAQKINADERQTPACQPPTEFQVGGKSTTAHVMTRSTDRGDTDRPPTDVHRATGRQLTRIIDSGGKRAREAASGRQPIMAHNAATRRLTANRRTQEDDRERQDAPTEQWRTQGDNHGITDVENDTDDVFQNLANIDVSDLNDETVQMHRDEIATEFAEAQRTDRSLQIGWDRAKRGSDEFKVINGLLYKRTHNDTNTVEDFALAVPQRYRNDLLTASHDCITSGHLGVNKCRQRLQAHFYWPKLQRDVAEFVRKCRICQLNSPLKVADRAPLQPMTPTLDTLPFSSISIDILGPDLHKTARGNRYLLCILCNSTKYLQVYPLRNLKASSICDKLLLFWCSVGISRDVFCDQMASFKSELIRAVSDKFGINMRYSVVYHAQSHGGIERTQRSFEDMLRKFLSDWPREWDKHVEFLQYAYNSSRHSSTGYSPFELVYGRKVCTPLALQRQSWENNDFAEKTLKKPVAKYMHDLSNNIQTMLNVAHGNRTNAAQRMKRDFDKRSSERHLKVNELALVLLPTSDRKLETRWFGPVPVKRVLPKIIMRSIWVIVRQFSTLTRSDASIRMNKVTSMLDPP